MDEVLGRLLKDAHRWAALDPKLQEVSQRLEALRPEVQDLAETCRDLSERFEADPDRLEEVEKRIALLKKLQTRYGKTPDELIAYRTTLDAKETALQQQEDDLAGIDGELRTAYAAMKDAAVALSKARGKVAKRLAADAQKHLVDLSMPKAKLDAAIEVIALPDDPMAGEIPASGHRPTGTDAHGQPGRTGPTLAQGGERWRNVAHDAGDQDGPCGPRSGSHAGGVR